MRIIIGGDYFEIRNSISKLQFRKKKKETIISHEA